MCHNLPSAPSLHDKERGFDLSVIIVNWNTQAFLRRCLLSVAQHTCDVAYEVLVVDNGSTDGSPEMVRHEFPGVHLFPNTANLGFARANNHALQHAAGRYLLLLNSDTALLNNALHDIVRFMDAHPAVGIVGPRLLNPDGSRQYSCDLFPRRPLRLLGDKILDICWPGNRLTRRGKMARWEDQGNFPVDYVIGAVLCIRRQTLEEIGLLDEQFFMYAEDIDWCYRAACAGWPTFYLGAISVYHYNRGSSETSPAMAATLRGMREQSLVRFYAKHYGRLAAFLIQSNCALNHQWIT